MFEQFTHAARFALIATHDTAREFRHAYITSPQFNQSAFPRRCNMPCNNCCDSSGGRRGASAECWMPISYIQ